MNGGWNRVRIYLAVRCSDCDFNFFGDITLGEAEVMARKHSQTFHEPLKEAK